MDAPEEKTAVLAGGCFWCVESVFKELRGVRSVRNAYAGGSAETANYRTVCSATKHAEAIEVRYDATRTNPGVMVIPAEGSPSPMRRDNIWYRCMRPKLEKVVLQWATFQVMQRPFATWSSAGIDAHTRSAQMGNTVDVNENDYVISSLADRLAAVRNLESTVIN